MADLLSGLNSPQKEAVLCTEGPLLVLAGAGSGKTRVLTHRIAYLIKQKGVNPSNILAITFTNKAANEMKERIINLLGESAEGMWIGTFHSICVRILRRSIEQLGYGNNFVIYDTSDQHTLIKNCLKELNLNEKLFPYRSVLEQISKAKNELIEPEVFERMYENDFRMSKIAKAYQLYQKSMRNNNALDFDDIIMLAIKLFAEKNELLEYYQQKFRYILVDEYQDTNTAQYTLVSLLAQQHRNLCVVGDDDQGIYSWRGANIRNILDFEKEFPDCNVIKLEQNYRSTKVILEAANYVIRNNSSRKNKKLWTENIQGEPIATYTGHNEHDEAMFVASQINGLVKNEGFKYKDIAVLYRMNAQSRVIEDMLMREAVPYKIFGGLRFYDRKEIKDVLAYLRLIANTADNVAFERVVNVPKRGIGDTTVAKIAQLSSQMGKSYFEIAVASASIAELSRSSQKLCSFAGMINSFRKMKDQISVRELVKLVIEESGIKNELENENTIEARTRLENINELLSGVLEFEQRAQEQEIPATLESYLEQVSLVSDIDNMNEEQDNVVLMTLHSAKGLEFPVVFIVGMEEGVFPGTRSMMSETELEEERRLCYVGITRAMKKLYITNAYSRTLFGNTTYNMPSRFIREIPEEFFCYNNKKRKNIVMETIDGNNQYKSNENIADVSKLSQKLNNSKNTKVNEIQQYEKGDQVVHRKFGNGVVISADKDGQDYILYIDFGPSGKKRIMSNTGALKKIQL